LSSQYHEKYVKPYLKSPEGLLCLWDWVYPNQFEAKMKGLSDYRYHLKEPIKKEISERELDRIVRRYS